MGRRTPEDSSGACGARIFVLTSLVAAMACADPVVPGAGLDGGEAGDVACTPSGISSGFPDLPSRPGPPAMTTGSVPHQQIDPDVVPEVIDEMSALIFGRAEVGPRPSTIVGGATAIWVADEVPLTRSECVVSGREMGHIHADGSVHVTLPHGRIPGAEAAGWVEPHPWADSRAGFEAYVLIFSPRDSSEAALIFDLVALGIDFVTGDRRGAE